MVRRCAARTTFCQHMGENVCRRALPDREHCPIAASCAGTLTSIGLAQG